MSMLCLHAVLCAGVRTPILHEIAIYRDAWRHADSSTNEQNRCGVRVIRWLTVRSVNVDLLAYPTFVTSPNVLGLLLHVDEKS